MLTVVRLSPPHVAASAWQAAESALGVDARGLEAAVARLKGRGLLATHIVDRPVTAGTLLAQKTLNASSGVALTGAHARFLLSARRRDSPARADVTHEVGGDLASIRIAAPGSAATVVVPNVRAGKSVLHVIDGVLFPLPAPAMAAQLRRAAEDIAPVAAPEPG